MKTIYYINLISILVLLFLPFLNPMVFVAGLIPLGVIQVISSFYLVYERDSLSEGNKKLLSIYYLSIFAWLILIFIASLLPNSLQFLAKILSPFPIVVAVYFVRITYIFYKKA